MFSCSASLNNSINLTFIKKGLVMYKPLLRRITAFLCMLLVGTTLAFAGDITGVVYDAETNAPLPGANIILDGTSFGVATGLDGTFTIAGVAPGNYTMTVSFIGYTDYSEDITVGSDDMNVTVRLEPEIYVGDEISVVADRAQDRKTPVAFTNVSKVEIQKTLGSRDVPMILNTTPSVYATEQGGGAGDSRINVRGFDQRNIAVMINGVPVNDMENGWVYWSNWDGLGDVTSSIQMQRGAGSSLLSVPSVGGTINVVTDVAALQQGGSFKAEAGSGNFYKGTLSINSGLINNKFAFSLAGVRKIGDGTFNQGWTDAWAYFGAFAWQINSKNRVDVFAIGAPQRHGHRLYQQNIQVWDADLARDLGINVDPSKVRGNLYNPNWGPISTNDPKAQTEFFNGSTHTLRDSGVIMERENFYHKPQFNLNWYFTPSEKLFFSNVFYFSRGKGGGSGPKGSFPSNPATGQFDMQTVYNQNSTNIDEDWSTTETRSTEIIRNSVNQHFWYGWIGKGDYDVNEQIRITFGLDGRYYKGQHWREVRNLIGGDYYLDFDDDNQATPMKRLGDRMDYHNDGLTRWFGGFGQVEGSFTDLTAFAALSYSHTGYKRIDYFRPQVNGSAEETDWANFTNYSIKAGANYNVTNAFNVFGNVGYISKAPIFDAVYNFDNSLYDPTFNEKITSAELGVGYRVGWLQANLSGYNTDRKDVSWATSVTAEDGVRYFFLLRGIDQRHTGVELDMRGRPHRLFGFNAMVSLGNWEYLNDVETTFSPEDNPEDVSSFQAYTKGLKVSDAAQKTAALGATVYPTKGAYINLTFKRFMDYYSRFDPEDRDDPNDRAQAWKTPNYNMLNLHAGWTLPFRLPYNGSMQIFVHGFNLLDEIFITDSVDGSGHDAASARVFISTPRRIVGGVSITM